jgi:hypothetical protein
MGFRLKEGRGSFVSLFLIAKILIIRLAFITFRRLINLLPNPNIVLVFGRLAMGSKIIIFLCELYIFIL